MKTVNRLSGSGKRGFGLALAAIALVAAIALGGGLATPRTADAQTISIVGGATDFAPGSSFKLHYDASALTNNWASFRILASSTAKGSFTTGGGQSLACRDVSGTTASTCDLDNRARSIEVGVNVASDSPDGPLVLQVSIIGGAANLTRTIVVNITSSLVPTKLTMTSNLPGIAATGAPNQANLTIKVTNATGTGLANQNISLTTTLGTLNCGGTSTAAQACTVGSTVAGKVVPFSSTNKAGTATITATLVSNTSLKASLTIVIYGPVAKITLAPDQETIAQRGVTFIIATVTDAGGNAVVNHMPTSIVPVIKGPSTSAVKVHVASDVARTVPAPTIPACGVTPGTNAKGQCVFRVSGQSAALPTTTATPGATPTSGATPGSTPTATATPTPTSTRGRGWQMNAGGVFAAQTTAKAATRGAHQITVSASAKVKATTTIYVGGPPKTITTDAPARVKALSETRVTVTVTDDTNIRVGAVPIAIDKIEGEGKITTPATTSASMTSDGRYAFTFLAPRSGRVAFLVSAGAARAQISVPVVIQVGDPPPAKTWSGTPTSGWNNLTWQGEDGAAVGDNIGPNVTAVYRWNQAAQRWDAYFPSAAGVPGGNDFTTLSMGGTYWVFSR